MMIDKFLELYERLPESTDYVTCRWFQAIIAASIVAVVGGAIAWPSLVSLFAIGIPSLCAGIVIGMRVKNEISVGVGMDRGDSCRA